MARTISQTTARQLTRSEQREARRPDRLGPDRLGPDHLIATFASQQHGYVTRRQLLDAGLTREQASHRVEQGRLIPVHWGVYAVGYVPTNPVSRAAAALLACGSTAMLSRGSAAALWSLLAWEAPLEITITGDRRPRGIRVYRCSTLASADLTTHMGLRVTGPARTLLDLAPRLEKPRLERLYNDALLSNYLRASELEELLARCSHLPGARKLREATSIADGPTRSQLEDAFLELVRRFELPQPQVNTLVAGHEVDACFATQRVIVELDGFKFHRSRRAFERDRERDAATLAAGYRTVRLTWARLRERGEGEAARLRTILEQAA